MAEQNIVLNTSNQMFVNTDQSKVFIGEKETKDFDFTEVNATYDDVTHKAGTVFGKVNASGKVIPSKSDAADGSQYVCGILLEDITVLAGTTLNRKATLVVCGEVNQDLLVFEKSGDTLSTVVDGRTYADRIAGDTVGILLRKVTDSSNFDNY